MKNLINLLIIFLSFSSFSYNVASAQVTQEWVKRYNGPSNDDRANYIAVDNTGNVYVTGYSGGSSSGEDFLTIKYNSIGDSLWVKRYNGPANGNDQAKSIAIDGLGNIYVTGFSAGVGTGVSDYVTIKYNTNGDSLWVKRYNGPGNSNDEVTSMVLDASNNIYITGYSGGNGTGKDYATIKYNSSGSLVWLKRYNGTGNGDDVARSISVDNSGNVFVTGNSLGVSTGTSDYATIKYNSVGDSLWVKKYNGPANNIDQANSIDIDNSGNVFVTGYSVGTGTGSSDYATIKYNSIGDSLWVKRYNGTANSGDQASSIGVDNSGNIFVTGYSSGTGTGNDYLTIKYTTSGVQQWVHRYTNGSDDQAKYLILDSLGNIYITGIIRVGGQAWQYDYATVKYNTLGDTLWVKKYGGTGGGVDQGNCIGLYGLQTVYVTGLSYFTTFGTNVDYATIKYSQQLTLNLTTLIEGFYNQVSNKMVKDTLRVFLRNANSPYLIVDSAKTYLDSIGNGILRFFKAEYGPLYYVEVKHRNSIETWSKLSLAFTSSLSLNYDFTSAANKAFGDNLILKGSKYCIISGDVNQDGTIDATDLSRTENDASISQGGYVNTDLNGDYFVDADDLSIVENNIGVSVVSP